jgi:hypothetical protein
MSRSTKLGRFSLDSAVVGVLEEWIALAADDHLAITAEPPIVLAADRPL